MDLAILDSGEEYNEGKTTQEKIKNRMTQKLKYLGHTTYPTLTGQKKQIQQAGSIAIVLPQRFKQVQKATIFGRAINLMSFIISPIRYKMHSFMNEAEVTT